MEYATCNAAVGGEMRESHYGIGIVILRLLISLNVQPCNTNSNCQLFLRIKARTGKKS
jgi:hypothetical protein